jgi:catechol 2,3-dioxygenase-like lactoylglutathione lyase family enzyme
MFKDHASSAIIPCRDLAVARAFYEGTLELPLLEDHGNGFVFGTGNTQLNIYLSDYAGTNQANAVLWGVGDELEAIAADLRAKDVTLDEYPDGFDSVIDGVHRKGDFRVIWFRDPDGNILHVHSR